MAKSQAGDTRSKTRARVKGRSSSSSSRSSGGASELKGRRFGRVLVKLGVLTRDQVQEALAIQRARKEKGESSKIGAILKDLGYIKEEDILRAIAGQAGMEMVDVDPEALELALVEHLPAETAKTYQIIPLSFDESSKSLTIAMKSPDNFRAVDDLRLLMGFNVNAVVAQPDVIDKAIEKLYAGAGSSMLDMMSQLEDSESLAALEGRDSVDLEQVAQAADDNKVIRLLNLVLLQAIKDKASDIHFEPFENEFKMRYRIDGVLYEMVRLHRICRFPSSVVSRSWPIWTSPNGGCPRMVVSS